MEPELPELRRGWSTDVIEDNVEELQQAGFSRKRALAIAYSDARQRFRARHEKKALPEHLQPLRNASK